MKLHLIIGFAISNLKKKIKNILCKKNHLHKPSLGTNVANEKNDGITHKLL